MGERDPDSGSSIPRMRAIEARAPESRRKKVSCTIEREAFPGGDMKHGEAAGYLEKHAKTKQ